MRDGKEASLGSHLDEPQAGDHGGRWSTSLGGQGAVSPGCAERADRRADPLPTRFPLAHSFIYFIDKVYRFPSRDQSCSIFAFWSLTSFMPVRAVKIRLGFEGTAE